MKMTIKEVIEKLQQPWFDENDEVVGSNGESFRKIVCAEDLEQSAIVGKRTVVAHFVEEDYIDR